MNCIEPSNLNENVFRLVGKEWMLITAGIPEQFNTMTASWGGLGVLWNRPVAFVFIRHERYTFKFIENDVPVTLSFLGEENREILKLCGTKSGRDIDKVKATGLEPVKTPEGGVTFRQSYITLDCRKLYADDIKKEKFTDISPLRQWYGDRPGGSFHRLYILDIKKVLLR